MFFSIFVGSPKMKEFTRLESAKKWNTRYLFARDQKSQFDDRVSKKFVAMDSYREYFFLPEEARNHYEIINDRQHLYFDIDIPISEDTNLISEIADMQVIELCKNIDIYLQNISLDKKHSRRIPTRINIYSSHTDVKKSYHIIVISHYVLDHVQNRYHCEAIKNNCNLLISKYIDMRVYRQNQQMRLLGSSKLGKNNYKILHYRYNSSVDFNLYRLFTNSLICHLQKGSVQLSFVQQQYKQIPLSTQIYLARRKKNIEYLNEFTRYSIV